MILSENNLLNLTSMAAESRAVVDKVNSDYVTFLTLLGMESNQQNKTSQGLKFDPFVDKPW
jgi:hypothetical protein